MVIEGIIIKGYSGFYYVWDDTSLWECSLRGKFRIKKQTFLPGDRVTITPLDQVSKKAVIEQVLPRQTELLRPPVANVEQVIIVVSLDNPAPDYWLLDRLLIMAQWSLIKPVICFNKGDLLDPETRERLTKVYSQTGFPVLLTSTKQGWGIDDLKEHLTHRISVFAGPSGVGKSSLLNALEKGLSLKTGEVSAKSLRGRHTTRHVELIRLASGGLLADTPGFSQVYLPQGLKREDLIGYYPDFLDYDNRCKFNTCLHRDEPNCAVKEAVNQGMLNKARYERYLTLLDEVIAVERRF